MPKESPKELKEYSLAALVEDRAVELALEDGGIERRSLDMLLEEARVDGDGIELRSLTPFV